MNTRIQRASLNNGQPYRYQEDVEEDDSYYPQRIPSSALRYSRTIDHTPVIVGNKRFIIHSGPPPVQEEEALQPRQRRRVHWSLIFGIGMIAMFTLWVVGNILINWWNLTQDDWHYGHPRTFQVDQRVGHNDEAIPSHFIAVNYNRHIEVIEFPAGDTTHAKIYQGPTLYGDGQDLAVVTLTFKDVNGDGKLDMIISVANTHIIYMNDGGQFRPLKPGEQVTA